MTVIGNLNQYTSIATEATRISFLLIERRLSNFIGTFNKVKVRNTKVKELEDLVAKARLELKTHRRQVVLEQILDDLEFNLAKL
jgi:hypothetical protein